MDDPVNNPSHYGQGKIEAIDYIEDFLTEEEYQGYLRGNIAKYLHRWPYKGKPAEDLKKARWYLDRLIDTQERATHEIESYFNEPESDWFRFDGQWYRYPR